MSNYTLCFLRMIPVVRRSIVPKSQTRNLWKKALWSDPFPEVSSTIRYVDRQMRDFDREIRRIFDYLDRNSSFFRIPRIPWDDSSEPSSRSEGVPIEVAADGSRKFKLHIDVSRFKPEEVKLNIKDRLLTVNAKRETKTPDGGRLYEEFTRQYSLPNDANPEEVRCTVAPDGILSIEAPLPSIEPPKEREIPVEIESSKKENV